MTSKRVRVLFAAGLLLVLCGGCFGNCITDFFDSLTGATRNGFRGSSSTYGRGYDYVIEADAGVSAIGDAGVE